MIERLLRSCSSLSRCHSLLVVCASVVGSAPAQDWPHWRGPSFDGSTAAKGLPTDFDQNKHVRWATDLPGPAACTPIVVGDRIFLSSVDTERLRLVAMCLDREDGGVVWKKDADSGYQPSGRGIRVALDRRTNYASPSPTTDGERVVFFFGNGDLVAYANDDGEELWRRNIQKDYGDFAFQWTFSAGPTLWGDKLYLPVLQRDVPVHTGSDATRSPDPEQAIESFVLAMDPETGETIYKHVRPSPARVESREWYGTIIPHERNGRKQLLIGGGDVLTGHDPESGAELWRWGTWNRGHREIWWRIVPSVVVAGDVAVVCAPKRAPVFAVKLGGEGELDDKALAWKSEGRPNPVSSDVPTPAYYRGQLYVLSDVHSALSKVDPKTGEVAWTTKMPGDHLWRASPTAADGKIWCMNHNGEVVVVDADDGEIVHRARMGEEDDDLTRSSIVVAHGCLFIRTNAKLYCVGA